MDPLSLLVLVGGGALGWYKLLGRSRRRPLNRVWFALVLAVSLGLSFLPADAAQNLSFDWLLGAGCGGYARAVRKIGRWDVWRPLERAAPADAAPVRSIGDTGFAGRARLPMVGESAAAAAPSSPAARRAVVRWAWRLLRREWRQHLIILSLITVAVAGTVVGAGVATNVSAPAAATFGDANHLVQLSGGDPNLGAELAALKTRFAACDVIENRTVVTGFSQGAELRAQNPDGRYGAPLLSLVSGRYPSSAGQVDLTASLAASLGLETGGSWNDAGHRLTVVGIVEDPQNLADEFALVPPGLLGPSEPLGAADSVTVLFDASAAQLAGSPLPAGMTAIAAQGPDSLLPTVIVLAVAILALVFTGLVAVAGFAALARRRQRALGMLAALGATERDVRLVILADGAMVGLAGATAGVVLGLAGWIAYAPRFSVSAGHTVAWTALPWWLVGCTAILAVVSATAAAWRPAHAVATMPVVAALSNRPAPPVPVYRSTLPALLMLIVGPVLLATSGGWGGQGGRSALFQLGGLLLSALGLALAAPFAVARLAGPAGRVPVAARLALRDLARHRSRSAAALAAGSLAVLIAMLVTLITTGRYSDPVDYFGPNLPADQLVVYAPGDGPGTGRGPNGAHPQAQQATYRQRADTIASMLGSDDVLELDPVEADLMHKTPQKTTGDSGSLYVATPAVLAHYGIDQSAIKPTTMLITSRPGLQGLSGLFLLYGDFTDPRGQTYESTNPPVQTFAGLPDGTSDPNLLVTEQAVRQLKLTVEPASGWLIQTARPLDPAQIETARETALAAGMTIETRSQAPSLAQVGNDATTVGILIALGVLAMMIGLIRAESADDVRTLAANGAGGRVRRNITATTAGTLALLAAVFGTAIAYVDTAAFFGTEFAQRMSRVPTTDLLLMLVGLPVAATLGGWLFSGREASRLVGRRVE